MMERTILVQLSCIAIAACLLSGGTGTVLAQEPPAKPELGLSVRDQRGLTGAPVFLTVRLRNEGAMQAARNAALLTRADTPDADAATDESQPEATEPVTHTHTLPLSGDWRERVTFELNTGAGAAALEPVLLTPTEHAPTEVGLLPLQATWAIPPDDTRDLPAGTYTVTAQLDPTALFPGVNVSPEATQPAATAVFSLEAAEDSETQAVLEETAALYYLRTQDCPSALAHAQEAIRLDSHRYYAYSYAAKCQLDLGNTEEAVSLLQTVLDVMPPMQDGGEYTVAVQAWLEELKQ